MKDSWLDMPFGTLEQNMAIVAAIDEDCRQMDNRAKLEKLTQKIKGMKPGDAEAEAILDSAEDWTGFWPVAKEGAFTGGICGVSAAPGGGPEAGYELSEDGMYAVKIGS